MICRHKKIVRMDSDSKLKALFQDENFSFDQHLLKDGLAYQIQPVRCEESDGWEEQHDVLVLPPHLVDKDQPGNLSQGDAEPGGTTRQTWEQSDQKSLIGNKLK